MKTQKANTLRHVGIMLAGLWAVWMWAMPSADAYRGEYLEQGQRYSSRSALNLRVSAFSGLPDLLGVSASLTALRPFAAEVGVSTFGLGATVYGKLGAAIPLVNTRNYYGRGITLDLMLMGGYRYLYGGFDTIEEAHALVATVGLDFTWWLAPHFGLTANLNGGGGFWLDHTGTDAIVFPEARFSIGMAF